jgi:hypothetical protein
MTRESEKRSAEDRQRLKPSAVLILVWSVGLAVSLLAHHLLEKLELKRAAQCITSRPSYRFAGGHRQC